MGAFLTMFLSVFIAEVGDKTQLATMLFASERKLSPVMIFLACGGALLVSAAIATFLGTVASKYLAGMPLKLIAGIGFIVIGALTVAQHYRGA